MGVVLVNNVIKHAQATIEIQISKDEEGVSLTIEDNGIGFDTSQQKDGIGLANLKTRIDFLKGEIEIQSAMAEARSLQFLLTLTNSFLNTIKITFY
jgi:two-component system NarL family sensor kinase